MATESKSRSADAGRILRVWRRLDRSTCRPNLVGLSPGAAPLYWDPVFVDPSHVCGT
jgi:hypothetical protein